MFLSLSQIYDFVHETVNSPKIKEGQEVLKSVNVVRVGCTKTTNDEKWIRGLIFKTRARSSFRYTIEGVLNITNEKVEIAKMQCTCKAELSGPCEHVVAVLLFMERTDINELEDFSSPDSEGVWSSGNNTHNQPKILRKKRSKITSNVKPKTPNADALQKDSLELSKALCNLSVSSVPLIQIKDDEIFKKNVSKIILNSSQSKTIKKLATLPPIPLKDCCSEVLKDLIVSDPSKLCYETAKNYDLWKQTRQLRISGSKIYSIYTYCKNKRPNWEQKSICCFWPREFTNIFVKHGLTQEEFARVAYEKLLNVQVVQCGFVVHPDCPWVGYSPDGIVFKNNVPERLIEIKCIYAGKSKTIQKCLASCTYLENSNTLKKRHPYYGQVQLGMLLLNLKKCDFIIYASFDQSVHVIRVDFDEIFALEMLSSVRNVYMGKMIHFICLDRDEREDE